ncbi:MotE family protein [Virgibacillus sp. W0430]|uniref:MotE family protein n=1 Tax=Virgibacillus sp. W0430 TaxID=3391580 RepID=UPI003F455CC9
MAKLTEKKSKKTNPFIGFLFVVVIPLIVAIVLTIIIMVVAGVDVERWIKKTGSQIPVVSSVVKTDEEKEHEQQQIKAKDIIEKQKSDIKQLTAEISSLQATNDELKQKIVKLEKANEEERNNQTEAEQSNTVKKASTSFRKMDKEKAARIFQNLDKSSAVSILIELPNDVRGEILGEMEPTLAAELTERLLTE